MHVPDFQDCTGSQDIAGDDSAQFYNSVQQQCTAVEQPEL